MFLDSGYFSPSQRECPSYIAAPGVNIKKDKLRNDPKDQFKQGVVSDDQHILHKLPII